MKLKEAENSGKINVLIVDDEALLRQGLKSMLEKEKFVNSVYEAEDLDSFQKNITDHRVDIVLLDVRLRGTSGLELLKKIPLLNVSPLVIAVTGLDGVDVIINLLKAGVHGIVYKLDGYGEISKAVLTVMQSGTYFPENILKIMQANAMRWEETPSVLLSFQEKELIKGIASGSTTKEIASDMKMSASTAETYRIRLMKKLGVSNTAALIVYAFRNGIL
jgi:DNA-binding NarL/FixJ family response regulator